MECRAAAPPKDGSDSLGPLARALAWPARALDHRPARGRHLVAPGRGPRLLKFGEPFVNRPLRGAGDAGYELARRRVVDGAMVLTGEKARCIRRNAKVLRGRVSRGDSLVERRPPKWWTQARETGPKLSPHRSLAASGGRSRHERCPLRTVHETALSWWTLGRAGHAGRGGRSAGIAGDGGTDTSMRANAETPDARQGPRLHGHTNTHADRARVSGIRRSLSLISQDGALG